jgi:hypothetical protein
MALLIYATETKKLTIKGTSLELPSIYARVENANSFDGLKMVGRIYSFESKELYTSEKTLLQVKELIEYDNQKTFDVDVAGGEKQSVLLFHEKLRLELETAGYTVEIIEL